MKTAIVKSVHKSASHTMNKYTCEQIVLVENHGVQDDAHAGVTIKHRSRVAKDPSKPNLRQVHLIHEELLDELSKKGFNVTPGQMGENITTQGINLLDLPKDTILKIGAAAEIRITGLRNPCYQLDGIQTGLMKAVLDKDEEGQLIRKAGIMGIVLRGGVIKPNDDIQIHLPEEPHIALDKV